MRRVEASRKRGVVLGGEAFTVAGSTRLEDEQGGEAAAGFVADEAHAGGARELRHLRLTGAMPK